MQFFTVKESDSLKVKKGSHLFLFCQLCNQGFSKIILFSLDIGPNKFYVIIIDRKKGEYHADNYFKQIPGSHSKTGEGTSQPETPAKIDRY